MKKSNLLILSSFAVLGLVSCGTTGYTHTQSSDLECYKADLNHDGKIEKFELKDGIFIDEEHLSWAESYDVLLTEANSSELLNLYADRMGIAKDEEKRTYLARYEIMHQAEELAMSTGALIPLYNYQDPYLLKKDISGLYCSAIGGKLFDQLKSSTGKKDFKFSIGTKGNSFDPAINDDAATASVVINCFSGICKWAKGEEIKGNERTYSSHLAKNYDILTADGFEKKIENGVAIYTIKIKNDLEFTTGNKLTIDNFIWSWNRAASPYTGTWVSMFENIKGYDEWKAKCTNAIKKDLPQPNFITEGMTGIHKDNDYQMTITLNNDCAYFEELLAFPAYMPLDMKTIEECESKKTIWWLNPSTFSTNGRLKVTELKNMEGGGVKMEKWDGYKTDPQTQTQINSISLSFLDSDSAMWDKYKSNALDMIDNIPTSLINTLKATLKDEWRMAPQIGIYYFLHNVNDNTFDIRANQSEQDREKLRKAFNLLLNRDDYTQTIVRSGATDASGFVSSGIVEQCIPGKRATGKSATVNGLWAKRIHKTNKTEFDPNDDDDRTNINDFELVSADWHERNLDMSSHWNEGQDKLGYKNYWLENRNDKTGGFYKTVAESGKTQQEVMKDNVKTAFELAKEAGVNIVGDSIDNYKFTNFPTVTITTNTGTGHEAMCERAQFGLKEFGINLRIQTQEWNAFQGTKKAGSFAVARNGWIADYSDPLTYLSIITSTSLNNDSQLGKEGFHKSR